MKINLDTPGEEAQIQIIPLIDVIFCILTFFILAALQLTRQQGIGLELPSSQTSSLLTADQLVINIDSNGQTYWSNQGQRQLIDRAQLFQLAQQYHQQRPEGLLVIAASQTAFYNDVIQTMDILRQVAPDRVALSTSAEQPAQPQQGQPQAPGTIPQITPAPNLVPPPTAPTNTLPTNPTDPNLTPTAPVQPISPQVPAPVPTTPGVPQSP